jgi:hypothetical protein
MVWNLKMHFQPLKIAKSYREAIFLLYGILKDLGAASW